MHHSKRIGEAMGKQGTVLFVLMVGLWLVAATAEPEVVEELAPIDQLASNMKGVRGMLRNADAKFRNGVTRGISGGNDVGGPATPGKNCCSENLQRLDKLFKSMKDSLGDLDRCYSAAGDRDARTTMDLVQKDLQSLKRAVQLVADVQEAVQTNQALNGCKRAFLLLEESLGQLSSCVPQPGANTDAP
jgi:hypothetical protein